MQIWRWTEEQQGGLHFLRKYNCSDTIKSDYVKMWVTEWRTSCVPAQFEVSHCVFRICSTTDRKHGCCYTLANVYKPVRSVDFPGDSLSPLGFPSHTKNTQRVSQVNRLSLHNQFISEYWRALENNGTNLPKSLRLVKVNTQCTLSEILIISNCIEWP